MPQIFPKGVNPLGRMLVLGLPMGFALTCVGLAAFYRSSYATGREEIVPQPIAFSHAHHVAQPHVPARLAAKKDGHGVGRGRVAIGPVGQVLDK